MRLLLSVVLASVLSAAAFAKESSPDIQVKVSKAARKILEKRGARFEDGLILGRAGKPLDLTNGGGALWVIPHPERRGELAVGLYDRGHRYGALNLIFGDDGAPFVSPFDGGDAAAAKLFPAEFGPATETPIVTREARELLLERGYVIERGELKRKGAAEGFRFGAMSGRGYKHIARKPGTDRLYLGLVRRGEVGAVFLITLGADKAKVEPVGADDEAWKPLFSSAP